jgi:hypothetical protein
MRNEKEPDPFVHGATEVAVSFDEVGSKRAGIILLGRLTGAVLVLLVVIFGFGSI